MARQRFGQTWWGKQWLNALTQIDYDNRLPRGRTYASKGAVRQMAIDGGRVRAQVEGSRSRPYAIAIDVPKIPAHQVASLIDTLTSDPGVLARLLNRELDPVVLERANQLGIDVFPKSWKSLSMQCSCPDWAVPCKHLAAVIYLLSREIDGNPFLVFALRGVDLVAALKKRGIVIESETETALPQVSSLLPIEEGTVDESVHDLSELERLDLSAVPPLTETLARLLPVRPAFHARGDFHRIYLAALKQIAKLARQNLNTLPDNKIHKSRQKDVSPLQGAADFRADDRPRFEIGKNYSVSLTGVSGSDAMEPLLAALERLHPADLPDLQSEVAALYHIRLAALHLLARGAVVPQLFALDETTVGLRWLPATLDESIRDLMASLTRGLPPGIARRIQGGKSAMLTAEAQALTLCSLFLGALVRRGSGRTMARYPDDKTVGLFFDSGRARFGGPGEGEIPAGIQIWLSRLHLAQREYAPVLCLSEGQSDEDFSLSVAVQSRKAPPETPCPLAEVLTEKRWESVRYGVLRTISLLADFYPPLQAYVANGGRESLSLGADELPSFLFETLPVVRLLGIRTLLPKSLDRILRPRLSLKISSQAEGSPSFLTLDRLLSYDWRVAVGGEVVTLAEFESLVEGATGIVRFRNGYVYLDPQEIERLRRQLEAPAKLSGTELLRAALAEEYAGAPLLLDADLRRILREMTEIGEISPPAGIRARLRPYQQRGLAWLYRNHRAGFGSVLADDMGLGKTLQVIALLLKLREEGGLEESKALIVVPTSLLTNWRKEIERFAPALSCDVYHGTARTLSDRRPDVLLTTYGVARTEAAALKKMAWRLVVVDEAQNIKNPAAAQTKAIKSIPASGFIAMSGTPVENRLAEYWSIMDFANRGYLGTLTRFNREFAAPIQNDRDPRVVERFRKITQPFLLRRLKSDKTIITDLPDKIEQNQYSELTREQAAFYESVVRESLQVIAGESDAFKRQGLVLQMIMALKQICNHPANYLKQGEDDPALSGKAALLLELLATIHESHEKVLVFTQFREMGTLLEQWIGQRFKCRPLFLHGGVSRKKRDQMVEKFQADRTAQVFILSLKAGGTGLNLTAASNVIHYDLWWNPAVEAQATDRAYRIGQQKNVQVHRLITRATFEERINEMIQTKKNLAELTVGAGEQWIGKLSDAELEEIFSLHQ
ncbi:SNF2-related protein [Methylohalobius crimeensis]|uniref:SNF2-related protein n=1 Tax=Methylohalobius crimeensis TaxID=244365 RepID=UPI0003B60979|nr:SNF2-related protein [Methylohalobius crimeensis]